jgi:hypothetical protein
LRKEAYLLVQIKLECPACVFCKGKLLLHHRFLFVFGKSDVSLDKTKDDAAEGNKYKRQRSFSKQTSLSSQGVLIKRTIRVRDHILRT